MEELKLAFQKAFQGERPTFVSRAPGRVNLIGEHTDYNGLPVFPMALKQEVTILFRPREDDQVRFANLDPEFEPRAFRISKEIQRDPPGDWGNYLKAPFQEMVEKLGPLKGMDALLTSNIPVAAGLSSSSAVVIAVGKALLQANEMEAPVLELAEEFAAAERYTGTQGGGMDQAISLGAIEGHASRIEFDPLSLHPSPVPPGWHFVVAHTLVRAEKSGGAQEGYNLRREECDLGLEAMLSALPSLDLRRGTVGPNQEYEFDYSELTYKELISEFPIEEMVGLAEGKLPPPLKERVRHVVTEGTRVYAAEAAMKERDLLTFGILMDASHESLKVDYAVSSPELDQLVELAREGGAAGARLTGAGFGGCIVALADDTHVESVLATLAGYYEDRGYSGPLDQVLFRAEPSGGATVSAL